MTYVMIAMVLARLAAGGTETFSAAILVGYLCS
jgi:hypothetical protein